MNTRNRGFTLYELIVVLALAAVILGFGVPSFRDFQRNNRLTVAANDVLSMVFTTRTEALRRQITMSMCSTVDGEAEDADCEAGTGWIVFEDRDVDCVRDDGEELITGVNVSDDVVVDSNTDCISFATTGFKRVVADQPATSYILYCDARGNTPRNPGGQESSARGVEVPPTGRGVVVKLVDEISDWGEGDDPASCPEVEP
jgi:prepilin-type N-terminal cleavage/methylation domain-containing protein